GSPITNANGQQQNWLKVIGPDGSVLVNVTNFSLMGRVFEGSIPGRVTVDRSSLTMNAVVQKLDVFATAFPTKQSRLPGSGPAGSVTPALTAYAAGCGTAADGTRTAPPAGTPSIQMIANGNAYWGQGPGSLADTAVCVADLNARDINGQAAPSFTEHP